MKLFLRLGLFCLSSIGFAQINNSDILFTVDNTPIKAAEFVRVYNKNLDLVKDASQKDVDAYLELFVNYQLKVKEAKRLGLDKDPSYLKEFQSYKKQLTSTYLTDNQVTDALITEAYERLKTDVKASHILIRIEENDKDTLQVYNQLVEWRSRIQKEGFDKVKSEVHNGSTVFAEELGYFTAFKMVYEFENAAYSTPVGEVSMPFRTRFGYHIVNVEDRRDALGEVTVAHIMVSKKPENAAADQSATRIQEIYKKIKQGENFEALAKQFSEDKSSAIKGGVLSPFSSGQLSSPEFEAVAFALDAKHPVSEPFESQYGWHIVKFINKTFLKDFDSVKTEIETKIKRDSRSNLINTSLTNKLAKQYTITPNPNAVAYFKGILTDQFFKNAWTLPKDFNAKETVLKIDDKAFSNLDFANYLITLQKRYFNQNLSFETIVEKSFKEFQDSNVLSYHEDQLEFVDEDFGFLLSEYRDGLLLFELMDKEVWNAASKDSIGLKSYYEKHKSQYGWSDRIDVVIASAASKKDMDEVAKALKKGKSPSDISKMMNTEASQKVIFTEGIMEVDHQSLPSDLNLKTGISKIYQYNEAYHVLDIKNVIPKSSKTFEESKGRVMSDYQNVLEENWIESLRKRYEVQVDPAILDKVRAQIN